MSSNVPMPSMILILPIPLNQICLSLLILLYAQQIISRVLLPSHQINLEKTPHHVSPVCKNKHDGLLPTTNDSSVSSTQFMHILSPWDNSDESVIDTHPSSFFSSIGYSQIQPPTTTMFHHFVYNYYCHHWFAPNHVFCQNLLKKHLNTLNVGYKHLLPRIFMTKVPAVSVKSTNMGDFSILQLLCLHIFCG